MKWIPGTAIPCDAQRLPEPDANSRIESFAQHLRRLRHIQSLTQSQLSLRSRVSRTSISHYECGRSYPQRHTLKKLAGALQVSIYQFDALESTPR